MSLTGFNAPGEAPAIAVSLQGASVDLKNTQFIDQQGQSIFVTGEVGRDRIPARPMIKDKSWRKHEDIGTVNAYLWAVSEATPNYPVDKDAVAIRWMEMKSPIAPQAFGDAQIFQATFGYPFTTLPVDVSLRNLEFKLNIRQPEGGFDATWVQNLPRKLENGDDNPNFVPGGEYRVKDVYRAGRKPSSIYMVISNDTFPIIMKEYNNYDDNIAQTNQLAQEVDAIIEESTRDSYKQNAQRSTPWVIGSLDATKFAEEDLFQILQRKASTYGVFEWRNPEQYLDQTNGFVKFMQLSTARASQSWMYNKGLPMLNMFVQFIFVYHPEIQRLPCRNSLQAMKERAAYDQTTNLELASLDVKRQQYALGDESSAIADLQNVNVGVVSVDPDRIARLCDSAYGSPYIEGVMDVDMKFEVKFDNLDDRTYNAWLYSRLEQFGE